MQRAELVASKEVVLLMKKHDDGKRFLLRSTQGVEFIAGQEDFVLLPAKQGCTQPYGVKTCNNCAVVRCSPGIDDVTSTCKHYKFPAHIVTGLAGANKALLASCRVKPAVKR